MKNQKSKIKGYMMTAGVLALSGFFAGCDDGDGPRPSVKDPVKSTVLVYAVATNSLSGNLVSDKNEMLEAAPYIDLKNNNVLVLETRYLYVQETEETTSQVTLLKLTEDAVKGYDWETVKDFGNAYPVLHPGSVSEVVDYVTTNYPAQTYGMVFWSHSTASQPYLSTKGVTEELPSQSAFGQDQTYKDDPLNQINVDVLAKALPDNLFHYIWFDSCYMSNIETIYEFRNKCRYFIGYPTEVLEYGLPYDIVLPHMVGEDPDLEGAARLFFKYYAESPYSSLRIATIAMTDMEQIEQLADICSEVHQEGLSVSSAGMLKYTRFTTGPFYDLGDYVRALYAAAGQESEEDDETPAENEDMEETDDFNAVWNSVIDRVVVYRAATPYNFSGQAIDPERYTGLSTHIYRFGETSGNTPADEQEAYYKSLGWFNRVF